ncbi:TRAUB-domain-containing protein [Westerdykella ornata]|uniref:Protein BFR2 n=1 Tax=Westerdykella ornata TaxID=318751 RepID=A0A6A6JI71_WESOR|nr:TRAUB-domain-containing protein [Westerdykella ornata]KAF2275336.1 TRAUB-domain-containing protein [Westerdykella ornata]
MKKSKLLDFDPEALLDPAPSSSDDENSGFESEEDGNKGREHYAEMGKSRLRKKEVVPLGPQYSGSRVSREAVEEEDSDDPFARGVMGSGSDEDEDEEGSEDEGEGGGANGVALNGKGAEQGSEEEEFDIEDVDSDEEMQDGEDDEYGEHDDESEGSDDEDEESDEDDDDEKGEDEDDDQTANLRKMMKDTSLVTANLSKAAQADVEKGKAIKAQRRTFDTLLNSRIRLQKALISTNSMAAEAHANSAAPDDAVEAAEAAALTLLNNLTDLRYSLEEARTGQKRKRGTPFSNTTASSAIWSAISSHESAVRSHRHAILEKWSNKTRSASTLTMKQPRLTSGDQRTLTDVLTAQMQDSERLIARTQVPRSCAPLQSSANIPSSEKIYDDADFYGLMLKQLLENRSSEINGAGSSEFVVQAPWQLAREAKTKKIVDTKASKGRKLRYTVHEKLQNFMAPEERGTWGERQRDELFGGLFGRRVGLGEEVESEEESDKERDAEEEGLKLFRS